MSTKFRSTLGMRADLTKYKRDSRSSAYANAYLGCLIALLSAVLGTTIPLIRAPAIFLSVGRIDIYRRNGGTP
jgi:hypothetical protein